MASLPSNKKRSRLLKTQLSQTEVRSPRRKSISLSASDHQQSRPQVRTNRPLVRSNTVTFGECRILRDGVNSDWNKRSRGKHGKQDDEKESLAFKILSSENTKTFSAVNDVDILQEKIAEFLNCMTHPVDLKEAAILDYYVAGFWWGKEQNYSTEQLSAFFTVLNTLLENIKERHVSLGENLKDLKKMFAGIGHSDIMPDLSGGLECFDATQAKCLLDYLQISILQHHKIYEYMFSLTQAEEIIGTDIEVEVPKPSDMPWPPPLIEAVPAEIHQAYIATPPPTPLPEEGEGGTADTGEQTGPTDEELQHEADILSQLSAEEVKDIMDSVFDEMLGGLKAEVATKLREKENAYINKINKIHPIVE